MSIAAWLPAAAWAALIFFLSSDSLSAERTRSWFEPILRFALPSVSPATMAILHDVTRELGHVAEYFVFFLLLARGFRRGSAVSRAAIPYYSLAVAALYSLTDEGHQYFVASRSASLVDCGFDLLGAGLSASVSRGIARRR
ncbi:MAG: VanZ family protein [Candidatus Binatia bacterium]